MKIGLLTAALYGDNSGDAFIEDAIQRIVVAERFDRFPLTKSLSNEQIEKINDCDAAIICGTNLYQQRFTCGLTEEIVRRIHCPIIPLGIGTSDTIGQIPRMDRAGVRAIAAIHRKCRVGSVRDVSSMRFLKKIGIHNVQVTGCPVLFHGLRQPDFRNRGDGKVSVSIRARLLHIASKYRDKQKQALQELCRRFHPDLVIQSPYDQKLAEQLASEFKLTIIQDSQWQADPYVQSVLTQSGTVGFRLHYGMLSLAYGCPTWFVAHDSRVVEFCKLVGLPFHDIRTLSTDNLCRQVEEGQFCAEHIPDRWQELAATLRYVLEENGLQDRLIDLPSAGKQPAFKVVCDARPKVLFLVDRPSWAFDHSARRLRQELGDEFSIDIRYVIKKPRIAANKYDLVYVFFWGEDYYRPYGVEPERLVKVLSSHRWEDDVRYGPRTPLELVHRYLGDAEAVACPSLRLKSLITDVHPGAYHTPNGIDERQFRFLRARQGELTIGCAGNASDSIKGFRSIVQTACLGHFRFFCAAGNVSHAAMNRFYNKLDVFAVASKHEGEPLTLIEAMAAGCFPVCTDVGIVPELIRHGENGYVVKNRTPEAFVEAFCWCKNNLDAVRAGGRANAEQIARDRNWSVTAIPHRVLIRETIAAARLPRFRNDDVSWDSDIDRFREFCSIFHRHGLRQTHGITLRGQTNARFRHAGQPAEYSCQPTLSELTNYRIREMATDQEFAERKDLIAYLADSPDEIALHGLYHTDYSKMSVTAQEQDIEQGLAELQSLFPQKRIRHFIAPFNRYSKETQSIARKYGLHLLTTDGIHLEQSLDHLILREGTWHRYHHHRFYLESTFDYYPINLARLDIALTAALERGVQEPLKSDYVSLVYSRVVKRMRTLKKSLFLEQEARVA
jgi:glycosyltransferase involved in cell wall biosynthesis